MLSLASHGGPSDEEIIREVEHLTQQIIPELIRRFDGRHTDEDVEKRGAQSDWEDLENEFEVTNAADALEALRKFKSNMDSAESRIAELDSELALIS